MRIRPLILAGIVLASATTYTNVRAGDQPASEAAFARLKTLVGRWQAQGDRKDAMTYESSRVGRRSWSVTRAPIAPKW
jgi:hypothetical protein